MTPTRYSRTRKNQSDLDRYVIVLQIVLVLVGFIFFLDEIWMFFPDIGYSGWILGDLSFLHVEPFHHWMLFPLFIIISLFLVPLMYARSK